MNIKESYENEVRVETHQDENVLDTTLRRSCSVKFSFAAPNPDGQAALKLERCSSANSCTVNTFTAEHRTAPPCQLKKRAQSHNVK